MDSITFQKLKDIETRYAEVERSMSDPDVVQDQAVYQKLARESKEISPIVERYRAYKSALGEITKVQEMAKVETDPDLRWVVVRDNHLKGPWIYCRQLKGLVDGLKPVAEFPANPQPGQSRVYVFEKPLNLAGKAPVEPRG